MLVHIESLMVQEFVKNTSVTPNLHQFQSKQGCKWWEKKRLWTWTSVTTSFIHLSKCLHHVHTHAHARTYARTHSHDGCNKTSLKHIPLAKRVHVATQATQAASATRMKFTCKTLRFNFSLAFSAHSELYFGRVLLQVRRTARNCHCKQLLCAQ